MNFDKFLNPERKPPACFTMEGFGDAEFKMRVVSREEEKEIRENYPDESDRMDAIVAYALESPSMRSTEFLDKLKAKEGRTILDPLDALRTVFAANECNTLFHEYSELAGLTVKPIEKIGEIKNE